MKLGELRPCDHCGGHIDTGSYRLCVSMLVVDPRALQQVVGLTTMLGGHSALAEVFAPDTEVVKVAGEHDSRLNTYILLCQNCALAKEVNIGQLLETAGQAEKLADG